MDVALRKQVYRLLIVVSAGLMFGRIVAVDRVDVQRLESVRRAEIPRIMQEKRQRLEDEGRYPTAIEAEMEKTRLALDRSASLGSPMFCANDRSRWCTLRALVEPEMRVVRNIRREDGSLTGRYVWYAIDKVQDEPGWDTIDMVKHRWGDRRDDVESPNAPDGYLYSSKPPLLVTLMALPYAVIYNVSGGRLSLGNETHLVVRTLLLVINFVPLLLSWCVLTRLIERYGTTDWGRIFTVAAVCFGTFLSTFVVTLNNHLPGFVCTAFALYASTRLLDPPPEGPRHPRWNAFFLGFWCSMLVVCEMPGVFFAAILVGWYFLRDPRRCLLWTLPICILLAGAYLGTNYVAHGTFKPPYVFKGPAGEVDEDNWYTYTYRRGGVERQSYWSKPVGMDLGEPSHATYAFHMTLGHHGIFSLTPICLLALYGGVLWLRNCRGNPQRWKLTLFILALSVGIFVFYLLRNQENRNYGGVTSGLRWTFWLVPMWLLLVQPAADRLSGSRLGRGVALLLLAVSCLSAAYPVWNPWTLPWLYHLLRYFGVSLLG